MTKILKLQLLVAVLLVCSSYSYSDIIYQNSGNAAAAGLNWAMANVVPQYSGLAINGVVYQYTTIKNDEDEMRVHVQNENALGTGYIFRETNDWTGVPGNTINRAVPVDYIPIEYWGDGSILVEGEGQVSDPTVIYTYRYDDTCVVDPQARSDCPGYMPPTYEELKVDAYDPLDDDIIQNELDRKAVIEDQTEDDRDRRRVSAKKKEKERLEKLLGITELTDLSGPAEQLHEDLLKLDVIPSSYNVSLPSTVYKDTRVLTDSELPDNKNARRVRYAQQSLHDKLVNLQYE